MNSSHNHSRTLTRAPEVKLGELLATWRDSQVFLRPNPGNGGDALICEATFRLFESHKIHFKIVRGHEDPIAEDSTVVFGGGGNLIPNYHSARRFIENVHARVKSLVILPHTIDGNDELLAQLGENTTVFAREKHTWALLHRYPKLGAIGLEHDMALSSAFDAEYLQRIKRLRFVCFRRYAKIIATKISARREGIPFSPTVLNCFRRDSESNREKLPEDNADLSLEINYDMDMIDRARVRKTAAHLFATLSWFSVINTDRLHMAIAASLLGKQVNFFEGNYWKNKAVYEHSLRDRFPKTVLRELT